MPQFFSFNYNQAVAQGLNFFLQVRKRRFTHAKKKIFDSHKHDTRWMEISSCHSFI